MHCSLHFPSLLVSDTHTCRKKRIFVLPCGGARPLLPFHRLLTAPLPKQTLTRIKHAATRQLAPRASSDVAIPQLQPIAEEKQTTSSIVPYREQGKTANRNSSGAATKPKRGPSGIFLQIERSFRHGQTRQKQQVRLHQPAQ